MKKISNDMNIPNEEIRTAESQHYFIDYLDKDTVTWYRCPWVHVDDVKRWCLRHGKTSSLEKIRIWRESDLSTIVTHQGEDITLREMFFGGNYQRGHYLQLVNYFGTKRVEH